MKVVLIGAGNVATQLGIALYLKGFSIVQLYSRTKDSASTLANRLQIPFTTDIKEIIPDADLYIFSVKDDAIQSLLESMSFGAGLYVHTAGSVPMSIFKNYVSRYGVLYPLQTFSKNRNISFDHIPVLYEANTEKDTENLRLLASSLSDTILQVDSEARKNAHLAAVFACNFANHMYTLASEVLGEKKIPREFLLPLIKETAEKIQNLHPRDAQTGPAIRHDLQTMQKHMAMLSDENKRQIYEIVSKSILGEVKKIKN